MRKSYIFKWIYNSVKINKKMHSINNVEERAEQSVNWDFLYVLTDKIKNHIQQLQAFISTLYPSRNQQIPSSQGKSKRYIPN